MNCELSQAQIDQYRTQGFLVVENFFSPEEISEFKEATNRAVQRRLEAVQAGIQSGTVKKTMGDRFRAPLKAMLGQKGIDRLRNGLRKVLGKKLVPIGFSGALNSNQGNPESYYAKVYTQCIGLAKEEEGIRKMIQDPRVGKAAATLAGVKGIRLYHDQALYKQAYGNPTAWHLDNPFWSFHSHQAMTMWVALEDATMNNGCMSYVPGTHLMANHEKNLSIGDNFAGLFKLYPDWVKIDPVSCPCKAGTVAFHNGLTAHGAGVNITNKPRKAYAVAFMPDGSVFNGIKDVLPADYFKSLKVGDVLNDPQVHPLVWKDDSGRTPSSAAASKPVTVGA